jgi:YfiH family protein
MTQATLNELYPVTVHQHDILHDLIYFRIRAFDAFPELGQAIFTRQGGVSRSPFDSLNLGPSVGDDPQRVSLNFYRACRVVETTPERTVACHLTHGADVFVVDHSSRQRVMGYGDALVTATPGIYLTMRFGDCTPLIFFDPVRGATGLAHAGWRGTMKNVAGATVEAMVGQLGCRPENIVAVIGPAIGPCCYEVGPDVMAEAAQAFDEPGTLFSRRNGRADRAYFDMWEGNRRQLAACGVAQIIQPKICTACHTDLFFSHRAENGRTGRFGVIVGLKEETP